MVTQYTSSVNEVCQTSNLMGNCSSMNSKLCVNWLLISCTKAIQSNLEIFKTALMSSYRVTEICSD